MVILWLIMTLLPATSMSYICKKLRFNLQTFQKRKRPLHSHKNRMLHSLARRVGRNVLNKQQYNIMNLNVTVCFVRLFSDFTHYDKFTFSRIQNVVFVFVIKRVQTYARKILYQSVYKQTVRKMFVTIKHYRAIRPVVWCYAHVGNFYWVLELVKFVGR